MKKLQLMPQGVHRRCHSLCALPHTSVLCAPQSRHPYYVLSAPSAEISTAWTNALWQAAIPRASLISHLAAAGRLADVVAACEQCPDLPGVGLSVSSSARRSDP